MVNYFSEVHQNLCVIDLLLFFYFCAEIDDFSYNGLNDSGITIFFDTSTSSRACINISIVRDKIFEGDEQFLVMFGNLPNAEAGVGLIQQACITIVDDDG